jgi:hypothetical protein
VKLPGQTVDEGGEDSRSYLNSNAQQQQQTPTGIGGLKKKEQNENSVDVKFK